MSDTKERESNEESWDSFSPAELHRVLFEESTDGMFITDPHWQCISANPSAAALTGHSIEELIGMTITDLIPPEDLERDPILMEDLRKGKIVTSERLIRSKNGSLISVEIRTRMLLNGNLLGIVHDITHRKHTEMGLRESEDKYRQLIETTGTGYVILDEQGRVTDANQEYAQLTGRQNLEDILEHNVLEWTAPHDIERNAQEVRKCVEQGFVRNLELDYVTPSGQVIPAEINATVLRASGTLRILSLCRNITERKQAKETIARERILSDQIINSLPGIFYMYDDHGKLVRWNKKHEEVTGYSPEELFGMHPVDFFAEAHKQYLDSRVQCVFAEGESFADAPILTKGGKQIPYFFTGRLTLLDGKQYLLGVGIDITERKRSEEKQNALQAQLLEAQKMESVARLAGGVAHDFNNMLAAILGHAELAMMRCTPSEQIHADLKAIEKSALRSAELVQQLLAFARRQAVAPNVLDLNDRVTDMLKMLRRLIGEDIDLVWMPGADLWPVKIDPSQIDQLLTNLCVNARDAIAGVGKVTIETENTSFDEDYCSVNSGFICGEYVMLAVSDNGCGMTKEVLDRLFEPFFTTKEVGKGTGLGLATVHGIVKQNKGFINLYSEPDNGSSFKIYLPRFVGEALDTKAKSTAETLQGRGETVLLVEDEVLILDVGSAILKELGYTVLTAGTTGQALRQAKDHLTNIQLLITDVIMPDMNGKDLAKLICDIKPGLKCIFTSGYTSNVIAHHGVLDEGVHFLQKPFSMNDLASKVREVLGHK
jgi:PAS domain S-box-containing protein